MSGDIVRLNVNLNAETAEALRTAQERHGISATETVRRAIGLLAFIESERAEGRVIRSVKGNESRELVFT